LLPYFEFLVQIAHLLRELISLFERPRTRLVGKIGSQNQSIDFGEVKIWEIGAEFINQFRRKDSGDLKEHEM